jgi:hypothetical protein
MRMDEASLLAGGLEDQGNWRAARLISTRLASSAPPPPPFCETLTVLLDLLVPRLGSDRSADEVSARPAAQQEGHARRRS